MVLGDIFGREGLRFTTLIREAGRERAQWNVAYGMLLSSIHCSVHVPIHGLGWHVLLKGLAARTLTLGTLRFSLEI